MTIRSMFTRSRLEKAIAWCDTQHEVTVTFHRKRALARVYYEDVPPVSSGWRKSLLSALEIARDKAYAVEVKQKAKAYGASKKQAATKLKAKKARSRG